jgi:hypothetical protein
MVQAEIKPDTYYDQDAVRRMLGLSPRTLGIACRSGQLRSIRRGGVRFFRGTWLIAWLEPESKIAGRSTC